jgi:hypothetical protein
MIMVTKTMKTMDEFMQQQQEEEEEEEKARGRPALQLTTMESSFSTEFVRRFSTSSPCEEQTRLRRRPLQRERQPPPSSSPSTTTTKAAVTNDIPIQINNAAVVALSPATAANLTLNGRRPVWHAASASDPSDLEAVCALNVAAAAAAAAFY